MWSKSWVFLTDINKSTENTENYKIKHYYMLIYKG